MKKRSEQLGLRKRSILRTERPKGVFWSNSREGALESRDERCSEILKTGSIITKHKPPGSAEEQQRKKQPRHRCRWGFSPFARGSEHRSYVLPASAQAARPNSRWPDPPRSSPWACCSAQRGSASSRTSPIAPSKQTAEPTSKQDRQRTSACEKEKQETDAGLKNLLVFLSFSARWLAVLREFDWSTLIVLGRSK